MGKGISDNVLGNKLNCLNNSADPFGNYLGHYRGDCIKSLGWINYLTQLVPSTETSHKKSYYHPHHLSNLGILSLST